MINSHKQLHYQPGLLKNTILIITMIFCRIVKPSKATDDDIIAFHSSGYLDFLKSHKGHEWDDLSPEDMEEAEVWGLGKHVRA